MNTVLELRQDIHSLIDTLSEHKLIALYPLLDVLADAEDPEDDILSEEEQELLEKCRQNRKEHPENFTSWQKVRRG